jgi:hypothetical protein
VSIIFSQKFSCPFFDLRNFFYLGRLNNETNVFMETAIKSDLEKEIETLNAQLTGDMFEDMDIRDKIHNLKMKLTGTRPMDSQIECVGCGS